MKLLKPDWVNHDGKTIFAVDIHPDGSRFATGGQGEDSGRIVIWNNGPVVEEKLEEDENVPKMLCQIDDHTGCVNCLRWSNNGNYLASGGDDKMVIIWQLSGNSGSSTVFGTGGAVVNIENWKSVTILRGHFGDVIDIAWSPDDSMVASGSVDNTVTVWNANKFPEVLQVIRGHEGLVKGVTFDPVGKYLASQADDKVLCIWHTSDWSLAHKVTEPFQDASGTTHALRLNWSPDGQYVVSAHAMNSGGPVAKIIERNGWKSKMDFVGHRKAITCVRFNERIFTRGDATKVQYVCCAIGSKDRTVSIWLTSLKRPLVVVKNLFDSSVMDMSWSNCGYYLIVCSLDGTVAYLSFSKEELGKAMSSEDKYVYHKKTYGTSIKATKSLIVSSIVENPDLLKFQQTKQQEERVKKAKILQQNLNASNASRQCLNVSNSSSGLASPVGKQDVKYVGGLKSMSSNEKLDPKDILKQQQESKTKEGKRRIVPMMLEPPCELSNDGLNTTSTAPFSNNSSNNNIDFTSTPTSKIFTSPSANLKTNDVASSHPLNISITKDEGRSNHVESSLMPLVATSTSLPLKRKSEFADGPPKKTKKKKEEKKEAKTSKTEGYSTPTKSGGESVKSADESDILDPTPSLSIPYPQPENKLSVHINEPTSTLNPQPVETAIEVENNLQGDPPIHYLRCLVDDNTQWENCVTSPMTCLTANQFLVCTACQDNNVHVFSRKGRRLLPGLLMDSPVSRVRCHKYYLMVITSAAYINVWNVRKRSNVICKESLAPLIKDRSVTITQASVNEDGCPVISLSSHCVYVFDVSLNCWTLLASASDGLQLTSDVGSSLGGANPPKGQLHSVQAPLNRLSKQMMRGLRVNPTKQETSTLSYLECQVCAARSLNSPEEYHHWLMRYTRHIVQAGDENRLRDMCEDLLGTGGGGGTKSDHRILCYDKRDLLKDLLPIIASNLRFQRFYTEFQQQLEIKTKR